MSQPVREVLADSLRGKRAISPGDPGDKSAAAPTAGGCSYSRFSLALVRHPPEEPYTGREIIDRSSVLAPFLHRLLDSKCSECVGALFLDARYRPFGHTIPFQGTISGCRVEPRELLVAALLANAAGMVGFHNHPSGDPTPSAEDRRFARRLFEAAGVVGVTLRDFLILGEPPLYWSARDGYPRCAPRDRGARRRRKPKYRHPDAPTQTWAGTGHMPVWLREEIEHGAVLSDFIVEGAQVTPAAARQEQRVRDRAEGGRRTKG